MDRYGDWKARKASTTGGRLDLSEIEATDPMFRRHFQGPRVRVVTTWDDGETYERTGVVSVTTGWRPALILVHRSSDMGSSDVLGPRDRVVAVRRGRTYISVKDE